MKPVQEVLLLKAHIVAVDVAGKARTYRHTDGCVYKCTKFSLHKLFIGWISLATDNKNDEVNSAREYKLLLWYMSYHDDTCTHIYIGNYVGTPYMVV